MLLARCSTPKSKTAFQFVHDVDRSIAATPRDNHDWQRDSNVLKVNGLHEDMRHHYAPHDLGDAIPLALAVAGKTSNTPSQKILPQSIRSRFQGAKRQLNSLTIWIWMPPPRTS